VALLARFDLVQARARLALDLNAVPAEDAADASMALEGARHPLLEEALAARGGKAVPISLQLGGDHPVLIISGPNTGGKTVSLKTAGLLCLMNQAGLLVPAVAARLPIFRSVLVDIGDHQSIAANLSTFSSHMENIGRMSREVDKPALVLLDEIGTGTDPEEGAALGVAILSHFHRLGALVVVTTHMSGIKQYGYATPGVKNACVEFDEATLRPTFRLLLGVAGSSSGIDIARRLGLPDEIVEAARARIGPQGQEADTYLKRVKETLHEVAAERDRVAAELKEAQRERARSESEARQKEAERARQFRQELAAVVDRYDQALRDTLRGLEDKAIRLKLEKDGKKRGADASAAIEREARERFAASNGPAFTPPSEVHAGDRVRIVSLGTTGVVESASEGRVRISAGGKALSVPLADLLLVERARPEAPLPPAKALPKGVSFVAADRGAAALELHLIGKTVDEALPLVDKFLDDAFLAGTPQVRLVHGHGTGTLRRAIAAFLKDHPHVANYRFGVDGEGGGGVTMVDLRR
jgi:DNA mismatch repair protein MutS2